MKVGFVGTGSMGQPMARNLVRAGHDVSVYNRTRSRAEVVGRAGARVTDSPKEAAAGAEVVVTMLADDAAAEAAVLGSDGVLAGLPRGATHASMSTISAGLSRRLDAAHGQAGQGYVAAPVFGRPEAAAAAKLWIVVGGPPAEVDHCRPVLDALGQEVIHVSEEPAHANVVKIGGNFLLAAAIEAMAEAFALMRKEGVDPEQFLDVVNGRVVNSPVYENYGTRMLQEQYEPAGFKLRHGLKDIRLALDAASEAAAPMPMASLLHDAYLTALARGWGEIDWAALGCLAAERAGLPGGKRHAG